MAIFAPNVLKDELRREIEMRYPLETDEIIELADLYGTTEEMVINAINDFKAEKKREKDEYLTNYVKNVLYRLPVEGSLPTFEDFYKFFQDMYRSYNDVFTKEDVKKKFLELTTDKNQLKLFEIRMRVRKIIQEESREATHQDILNYFSDLHKSVNGFRPNLSSYVNLSDNEIWEKIKELQKEEETQAKFEEEQEKINIENFEKKIKELINMGAGDRATALRWLYDSEDYYDIGDLLYSFGLSSYSEKGKQIEKELEDALKSAKSEEMSEVRQIIRKLISEQISSDSLYSTIQKAHHALKRFDMMAPKEIITPGMVQGWANIHQELAKELENATEENLPLLQKLEFIFNELVMERGIIRQLDKEAISEYVEDAKKFLQNKNF